MEQEQSLYLALLADLTDEKLTEIFGLELKRRGRYGVAMCVDLTGDSHMAVSFPSVWAELDTLSASEQLGYLAAYLSIGVERSRGYVEEGD